ncbi:hypothetical protein DESC_480275 [Desulfosarcina cetonica]|nr:hypothetical protein DESC_480275 [Desulfosarcina cetonica]
MTGWRKWTGRPCKTPPGRSTQHELSLLPGMQSHRLGPRVRSCHPVGHGRRRGHTDRNRGLDLLWRQCRRARQPPPGPLPGCPQPRPGREDDCRGRDPGPLQCLLPQPETGPHGPKPACRGSHPYQCGPFRRGSVGQRSRPGAPSAGRAGHRPGIGRPGRPYAPVIGRPCRGPLLRLPVFAAVCRIRRPGTAGQHDRTDPSHRRGCLCLGDGRALLRSVPGEHPAIGGLETGDGHSAGRPGRRPYRDRLPHVPNEPGCLAGQGLARGRRGSVHQRALPAPTARAGHGTVQGGVGTEFESGGDGTIFRKDSHVNVGSVKF